MNVMLNMDKPIVTKRTTSLETGEQVQLLTATYGKPSKEMKLIVDISYPHKDIFYYYHKKTMSEAAKIVKFRYPVNEVLEYRIIAKELYALVSWYSLSEPSIELVKEIEEECDPLIHEQPDISWKDKELVELHEYISNMYKHFS